MFYFKKKSSTIMAAKFKKKNEIYYYHHSASKLFVGVLLQNFGVKLDVSSSRLEIKRNILKIEIYYGKDQ